MLPYMFIIVFSTWVYNTLFTYPEIQTQLQGINTVNKSNFPGTFCEFLITVSFYFYPMLGYVMNPEHLLLLSNVKLSDSQGP